MQFEAVAHAPAVAGVDGLLAELPPPPPQPTSNNPALTRASTAPLLTIEKFMVFLI